jgi:DNA-directed RNA polymerase III subunit RPC1
MVRKAGTFSLKIAHDKFKAFNASTSAKKQAPPEKVQFDRSFENAKKTNNDLEKHLKKAMDDLNPLRTLKLFRRVRDHDRELLGLRTVRPEAFIWCHVPAPPVCIRPSVGQDNSSTTEDDITAKLGDIVAANTQLQLALEKGAPVISIIEHWDYLSLQIAMYINSDVPGLQKGEYGKQIRGFVQRLKGKQGRFRGNLSGKRVDFSGRTVISPDPNLAIDEVAVPELVAKNMTYPERVSSQNKKKLQQRVKNGTTIWPGANYVHKAGADFRLYLKYGNKQNISDNLQEGDVVERHLEDGDIVLFNRQPSLHKLSIMAHYVKVRKYRTFRLNECVCNPYNADFDGDEMNLHVPQTEEARTEAKQLMGVKHNIVTPKNGEPIISAIQDFITAAFLLSSLDQFYDKKTFVTTCLGMLEPDTKFELPPPATIKPQMLWTGKQVFNVLMRPNRQDPVMVNLNAKCRDFKDYHHGNLSHRDLQDDSFLCIRNSEIMCGRMDKSTVGAGKKDSLFYIMYRDFGPDASATGMNRLSKLCARWLSNEGFSVGISDVTPPSMLQQEKDDRVLKAFSECTSFVQQSKAGKLKRLPGQDDLGTLETNQVTALSKVRTEVAESLVKQLSKRNSPMVMATSGSKGSNVNVAQMAALLGQQDIEGKRVADGFQDRTLPHFAKHERSPPSKGFVSNSFYSGLKPHEFLFHAVGGRVGLVDTAVKTAETGYMSRRLMKSLEDLSTKYDRTVRNSTASIVQFLFGDDELDPVDMEAAAKPVHFERTFAHIEATTFSMKDAGLSNLQISAVLEDILAVKRRAFTRKDLLGKKLAGLEEDFEWTHETEKYADDKESAREFLQSISDFILGKSGEFELARLEKGHFKMPDSATTSSKASRGTKRKSAEPEETSTPAPASGMRKSTRNAPAQSTTTTPKSAAGKKRKTVAAANKEAVKAQAPPSTKDRFELTSKLSERTLRTFIKTCLDKYERAKVEPGHAVGAVGAQSIGEPGTQMTLKTFHFAGVAGMSLTAGVPRIKEIINASKDISTPVITVRLERRSDLSIPESLARIVKGRIEALRLEDVTEHIQITHSLDRPSCLNIKVSRETIDELGLDITLPEICDQIRKHRRFKGADLRLAVKSGSEIRLSTDKPLKSGKAAAKDDSSTKDNLLRLHYLKRFLPGIQILGHPQCLRAVVMTEDDPRAAEVEAKQAAIKAAEKGGEGFIPAAVGTEDTEMTTDDKENLQPPKSPEVKQEDAPSFSSTKNPPFSSSEPPVKIEDDDPAPPSHATTDALFLSKADVLASQSVPAPAKPTQMHRLLISGYGLRYCMNTPGVDPYHTSTNSIVETLQVLGIEAARSKIVSEIQEVTKDLSIDPRHMALLADVMTYKGEVLGITRFGLAKMRDSVLQLASFEKTADHVFEAGVVGKVDDVRGVSECVIVGKTMGVGTGSVEIVRRLGIKAGELGRRKTAFEDSWGEYEKWARKGEV